MLNIYSMALTGQYWDRPRTSAHSFLFFFLRGFFYHKLFPLYVSFPFIPIQKELQHTAGLQAKRKHRKRVHNVKLEGAELQGAAGELELHSMWYETEAWLRDTEEHKITSYQLKGLISPQRGLCVTTLVCEASEGCLQALATPNNLLLPYFSSIQASFFHLLLLLSALRNTALPFCSHLWLPRTFCSSTVDWFAGAASLLLEICVICRRRGI